MKNTGNGGDGMGQHCGFEWVVLTLCTCRTVNLRCTEEECEREARGEEVRRRR